MLLFGLPFIICISYLHLSVQDETTLAIDSLLYLFPIFETRPCRKGKRNKKKGQIFGSPPQHQNDGNTLFTFRFHWLKGAPVVFGLLYTSTAKGQVFYPTFYPENGLLTRFERAKTQSEQMDASPAGTAVIVTIPLMFAATA